MVCGASWRQKAPGFYSVHEEFFDKDRASLISVAVTPHIGSFLSFGLGYGREFTKDSTVRSPLWANVTWKRRVSLKGEIYYDLKSSLLERVSLTEYGKISLFRWSIGYSYYDPFYAFTLLGFSSDTDVESVKPQELSRPRHRVEASINLPRLPLGVSFGGWTSLFEENSFSNLWIRFSSPWRGTIPPEVRFWSNPEVEREVRGYLGFFLPFNWRYGK